MPWDSTPVQVGIVVAVAATLGYVWHETGRGRWRAILTSRFIYGVPWGTLITAVGVVGFYLVAQHGLWHWNSPVTLPYRSWSYTYPLGWLAAGFAHANPSHLIGNMVGTLVLAPIVEYAWGHYPPGHPRRSRATDDSGEKSEKPAEEYAYPPPAGTSSEQERGGNNHDSTANSGVTATGAGMETPAGPERSGWLAQPWVRALVAFPLFIVVVSILTSFFALGWSMGFSGTVFVLLGFALVKFPMTTVVAMVAMTGLNVLVAAIQNPVLRATADPGAPSPPGWAGVNVQAHMLGFLIGVILAFALVRYRNERPNVERVAFAAILVVLARQLWLIPGSSNDVYYQYRGIGLIFVFALTTLIIAIVAVEDRPLLAEYSIRLPSVEVVSLLWLMTVAVLGAGVLALFDLSTPVLVTTAVGVFLGAVPALPALVSRSLVPSPVTTRTVLVGALVVVTVIIALPSLAANYPSMDDDPVPGSGAVVVDDYVITYEENAPSARTASNSSGVIVVSEDREVWASVVDKDELAHTGEETVTVGSLDWREEVTANRSGWSVAGNDSVYVVDLEHDGETTRSFTSDGAAAGSTVANQTITVRAVGEEFRLNVTRHAEYVGETPIPSVNETATVGTLTFETEVDDDTREVFAEQDGTRVLIAQEETY